MLEVEKRMYFVCEFGLGNVFECLWGALAGSMEWKLLDTLMESDSAFLHRAGSAKLLLLWISL